MDKGWCKVGGNSWSAHPFAPVRTVEVQDLQVGSPWEAGMGWLAP